MTALIVCATRAEAEPLLSRLHLSPATPAAIGHHFIGPATANVALLVTGVGKTNSALALASFIHSAGKPQVVVNTGVAGAYPQHGASVGHVAVATSECYADEGVQTPDRYLTMSDLGFPISTANDIHNDTWPLPNGPTIARKLQPETDIAVHAGPFITVSTCAGTQELADMRAHRFHPLCETMEGAALCHTCAVFSIPFVEIRGISNLVGRYDKSRWDMAAALDHVAACVQRYLES